MARKTKTDTALTRQQIIAAARRVFAERGVSRTTLAQIAKAANVTRGAIYWHFKNKPDLFFAMLEQISLPLIHRFDETLTLDDGGDPLRAIQNSMTDIMRLLSEDEASRATLEIVLLKCEYVDEFASLDIRVVKTGCDFVTMLTRAYGKAREQGLLREGIDPHQCAMESHAFMKGLMHLWLSDTDGVIIRGKTQTLIETHIAMRYK